MALIGMAVYSTEENKKDECLAKTLSSLDKTVDFKKHRLMLSVNGATQVTKRIIHNHRDIIERVFWNDENLGTAEAINKVINERKPNENVIKIDDDIIIHQAGWVELMEEVINIDPDYSIVGLKRKDLFQTPWHEDPNFRSKLRLLPHVPGHRWIQVEESYDIIGSCTMFSSALLDKVGFSRQPGLYGFEDNLMCHRSHKAGFKHCFLNQIEIDHIDEGKSDFQKWKEKHSSELFPEYYKIVHAIMDGTESIYYNPFK